MIDKVAAAQDNEITPAVTPRDVKPGAVKSGKPGGKALPFIILGAGVMVVAMVVALLQMNHVFSPGKKAEAQADPTFLTQYTRQLHTAVLRLVINGVDTALLQFNAPSEFTGPQYAAFQPTHGVFNVSGGGATFLQVPAALHANNKVDQNWIFNMDYMIPMLGSDNAGGAGNDLIAFADDLSQSVCSRANNDMGFGPSIPVIKTPIALHNNRSATATVPDVPVATGASLDDGASPNWFRGKTDGCFQNGANGNYVFYSVLAER